MNYIPLQEAAETWGVTARMAAYYCQAGRVAGAVKQDGAWRIPAGAEKPAEAGGPEQSRGEYLRRIHRVQDYIEAHLAGPLTLADLAGVAGFSKFHFERIFKGLVHEPLAQYAVRIRLERAALALLHRPDLTVTAVAYHFGFSSSAAFSRAFKQGFGVAPAAYRNQNRTNRKALPTSSPYNGSQSNLPEGSLLMNVRGEVEILTLEEIPVAYLRYTGTYPGLAAAFPGLIATLSDFAARNDLIRPGQTRFLVMYHDHPEVTPQPQLRTSLGITLPAGVRLPESGQIGRMTIPPGLYASGHFEISAPEYGPAWDYLYGEWLAASGYQPRDTAPFELYIRPGGDAPGAKHRVDLCVPIEPLGML